MIQLPSCVLSFLFILPFFECIHDKPYSLTSDVVVNASELPGPLPVWKTLPTDSGRRLIINLDHPELPWAHVSRSIQEAYNFCLCMDIRLRQGNASASAFPNYFEQDLPVVVSPEPMPEMENSDHLVMETPFLPTPPLPSIPTKKHFPTPSRNPSGRATRPEESTSSPGGAFKKKRMRPPGKMTSWLLPRRRMPISGNAGHSCSMLTMIFPAEKCSAISMPSKNRPPWSE